MNQQEILKQRMTIGRRSGKTDRSYVALLSPHEYLYMETSYYHAQKPYYSPISPLYGKTP